MQDLLQPVSQRAGNNSLSTSAIIFALNFGSGSAAALPVLAAAASVWGRSSPSLWASLSPTEEGPRVSSVKSFPEQRRLWPHHPEHRTLRSVGFAPLPCGQQNDGWCHLGPQHHCPHQSGMPESHSAMRLPAGLARWQTAGCATHCWQVVGYDRIVGHD